MKRLFQIKIFVILFSITGAFVSVSNTFHLINEDRIELLENRKSDSTYTLEITNLTTSHRLQYYSVLPIPTDLDIQNVLKYQLMLYRNIKNCIAATFIISHQTNFLPRHIS